MAALICAAAYQAVGLSPEIHFIQYGTKEEEELEVEEGHLFVDITPPANRWQEWKNANPIILDHHETREHVTKGLGGVYGFPEYSGASLAFMHVMVPLWFQIYNSVPEVQKTLEEGYVRKWAKYAILAQIRDNWKATHPAWFDAASFGQGITFFGPKNLLDDIKNHTLDLDEVLRIGKMVYERILRKAEHVAGSAYTKEVSFQGEDYKLGFFNSTEKNISEVAHRLLEEHGCDLASGYFPIYQDGKFRIIVSLRTGKRLNARKIAEAWGGGGHPTAAGFKMDGPKESDALDHTFRDIIGWVEAGIVDAYRKDR